MSIERRAEALRNLAKKRGFEWTETDWHSAVDTELSLSENFEAIRPDLEPSRSIETRARIETRRWKAREDTEKREKHDRKVSWRKATDTHLARPSNKRFLFQPLKSEIINKPIAVFDLEAEHWVTPFALGFSLDGEHVPMMEGPRCVEAFLDTLLTEDLTDYRWYAHYGGRFDFLHLLDVIMKHPDYVRKDRRLHIRPLFAGSRLLMFRLYVGKLRVKNRGKENERLVYPETRYEFVDSFNLLPMGLDDATYEFGVVDQKMKPWDLLPPGVDFETFRQRMSLQELKENYVYTRANWKANPKFKEYLRRDVAGLHQVLTEYERIVREDLGGKVRLTLASTAMDVFKRNHLPFAFHDHQVAEPFIRQGYYGGRVEIFRQVGLETDLGKPVTVFDVNSLYPTVMEKNPFPVGRPTRFHGHRDPESFLGWARARVTTPMDGIPVLPHRDQEGKLNFPGTSSSVQSNFEGIYSTSLLAYAQDQGYEIRILEGYAFHPYNGLFTDYVRTLHNKKEEAERLGHDGQRYVFKTFMNGLYGKFGQHRIKEDILMNPQFFDEEGRCMFSEKEMERIVAFNEKLGLYKKENRNDSPNILPAIASQVTSLALIELHKWLKKADKTGVLFYCDTDSIHTTADLPTGTALGELKIEKVPIHKDGEIVEKPPAIFSEAYYYLPKTYCGTGLSASSGRRFTKICAKGLSASALTNESFRKALLQGDLRDFNQSFSSLLSFKQAAQIAARDDASGILRVRERKKSVKSRYDKRTIHTDGSTSPLVVTDDWLAAEEIELVA